DLVGISHFTIVLVTGDQRDDPHRNTRTQAAGNETRHQASKEADPNQDGNTPKISPDRWSPSVGFH
ncbi:MAG: hypothetical protein ACJ8BC_10280, partial [Gemmatimonadales bacterium]